MLKRNAKINSSEQAIEAIRLVAKDNQNPSKKEELGQVFTPLEVSKFLVDFFDDLSGDLRILDCGAGTGILSGLLALKAIEKDSARTLSIIGTEIDSDCLSGLTETYDLCMGISEANGVQCTTEIVNENFLLWATKALHDDKFKKFNKAILNPPYAKIKSNSSEKSLLKKNRIDASNLYAGFVGLALLLLEEGGELVAITPRSFCNGPYFKKFREFLFQYSSVEKIHVFESRKSAFSESAILQENIVFQIIKGKKQGDIISSCSKLPIYNQREQFRCQKTEVIGSQPDRFIHIITSDTERNTRNAMASLPCNLSDLNLNVSTGPIVDFRLRKHLRQELEEGCVPLIFPKNVKLFEIQWPQTRGKENAIELNNETQKWLLPAGNYVLAKRMTSKEEKRRIVPAVISKNNPMGDYFGFDNMTNYFHANGSGMIEEVAKGLAMYLASDFVDDYFRLFSGHTQVNATDLKNLRYPSVEQLHELSSFYDYGDTIKANAFVSKLL